MTEHFAGNWPFWVSPRQVIVVPVGPTCYAYATALKEKLWNAGLYSEVDVGPDTLPKKIRNAETARWNFVFVVGNAEVESGSVNVRNRDDVGMKQRSDETVKVEDAIRMLLKLKGERRVENKLVP